MSLFETAFDEVAGLVRDFEASEDFYLSNKYQESEVRTDYIDKFWSALGWDVRHKYQTNPREQEVKVEKNPDSNASGRKADYAFYLKPEYRSPVFFCEAKKPRHDLGNPEFYFQLVRYGRAAGTPVSVLFDFEELHVVDCRYEANLQKSFPSAQIKAYHYKDYLDRDKFGEIYWLFSREAIESGKLKSFSKELPKQRGKGAAKLTAEEAKPTDEAFLTKLEEYRLTLAKAFKKADGSLDAETLTEATQKVIDRLVFIRFLEDKNIEADYIVDQIAAKAQTGRDAQLRVSNSGAWKSFIAWSRELDVKYNGVVFKPHEIDKPTFKAPDDKVFGDICRDISFSHSKYVFSYIPIELIGSIYERFLGKVVTATAKRADIEYKPEVRKAGGVYYTPKYIVDYIVANTVGKILNDSPSSEAERKRRGAGGGADPGPDSLASDTPPPAPSSSRGGGLAPKEVSKLRFADIACGSGSFLIAVYDAVLHHVESWYNAHPDEARKAKCVEIGKGVFTLSLRQKQQILLDNIYGVDIDPQAVEVAQLSLFLKLLEGESGASTGQMSFEKTKILPDLSKNIQCGNSLVDYDIEQLFPLTVEERQRINPFNFESQFKLVMQEGGFDAIVGNPPYVRIQILKETLPQAAAYFKTRYATASRGNYDIYVLFVEEALKKLNKGGELGYILPNKFTNSEYGVSLRTILSERRAIQSIVDFGHSQVFLGATTYTCLLFLRSAGSDKIVLKNVADLSDFAKDQSASSQVIPASTFGISPWRLRVGASAALVDSILNTHIALGSIADQFVGLQTSADDVFILNLLSKGSEMGVFESKSLGSKVELELSLLHPLVSGTDIRRYAKLADRQYILFPYEVVNEEAQLLDWKHLRSVVPRTASYLEANKARLSARESRRFDDSRWYRFGRSQNLGIQERPKLCVPRLVERLNAAYDSTGSFYLDNVDVGGLTLKQSAKTQFSEEYLLALINSKLLGWLFPHISAPFRGGWYSANRQFLSHLPIAPPTSRVSMSLKELTTAMTAIASELKNSRRDSERDQLQRKCDYLDSEIDRLVYELYGLTEDEIRIVEGR